MNLTLGKRLVFAGKSITILDKCWLNIGPTSSALIGDLVCAVRRCCEGSDPVMRVRSRTLASPRSTLPGLSLIPNPSHIQPHRRRFVSAPHSLIQPDRPVPASSPYNWFTYTGCNITVPQTLCFTGHSPPALISASG